MYAPGAKTPAALLDLAPPKWLRAGERAFLNLLSSSCCFLCLFGASRIVENFEFFNRRLSDFTFIWAPDLLGTPRLRARKIIMYPVYIKMNRIYIHFNHKAVMEPYYGHNPGFINRSTY